MVNKARIHLFKLEHFRIDASVNAFIWFAPKDVLVGGEVFVESKLLKDLAEKKITKETLFRTIEANFELLPEVLSGVSSQKAAVRYPCASILVDLTSKHPEKMYPHM